MNTITQLFDQAELAEAAYANFWDKTTNSIILDKENVQAALKNQGFSTKQAADFLTHWKIIDQCPNTDSGFSATVFERLDGPDAGKLYIATCGTEGSKLFDGSLEGEKDIIEDLANIGADGIAINQAIDMYNWYLRLISPGEASCAQFIYHKEISDGLGHIIIPASVEQYYLETSKTGALSSGRTPTEVIGHSLGGHLAMILSRMFSNIASVTTFNAPGFDSQILVDLTKLGGGKIFPKINPLTSQGFFDLLKQVSDYADQIDNSWTASMTNFRIPGDIVSKIGTVPNEAFELFSEDANTDPYSAHLMPAITDSLAVYDLFIRLDSRLVSPDVTAVLSILTPLFYTTKRGRNRLETNENIVNALGDIFVDGFTHIKSVQGQVNRNDLYSAIAQIRDNIADKTEDNTLLLDSLVGKTQDELFNASKEPDEAGLAYRYALVNCVPFVITGDDTLYNKVNEHGELNIYNPDEKQES